MIKQWISTKNRLPDRPGEVVVKVKGVGNSTVAFFSTGRKQFITTDKAPEYWMEYGTGGATAYKDDAVTHWMPLPDFPQKSQEGFTIKPLKWKRDNGNIVAHGSFGTFEIEDTGVSWEGSLNDSNDYDGYESKNCKTFKEAKAHCQTLHEKQIMAALEFVEVEE